MSKSEELHERLVRYVRWSGDGWGDAARQEHNEVLQIARDLMDELDGQGSKLSSCEKELNGLKLGRASFHLLWRGECGHHWIRAESESCPLCRLRNGLKRLKELDAAWYPQDTTYRSLLELFEPTDTEGRPLPAVEEHAPLCADYRAAVDRGLTDYPAEEHARDCSECQQLRAAERQGPSDPDTGLRVPDPNCEHEWRAVANGHACWKCGGSMGAQA